MISPKSGTTDLMDICVHDNERNSPYSNFITQIQDSCVKAFPEKMDMAKNIQAKKTRITVSLIEMHNMNSRLSPLGDVNEGI